MNTRQLLLYTRVDLIGKTCSQCGRGEYNETSIHDDWEGKLHCDKCNHEVMRYQQKW